MTVEEVEALVKQLGEKRERVAELKKPYSEAVEELERFEGKLIGVLTEMGKSSYKGEAGTITKVAQYRFNLPRTPEDRKKYFDFLKERGLFENMVTVNANTHNSFCKEEWEHAKAEDPLGSLNFAPPGIEPAKMHETIQFRKK